LLSLAGMSALIALLVQLLKRYLGEWRFTQLLAMGIGLVVGLVATWIVVGLSPRTILDAILLAIVAGTTASGGYELVSNLAGLAGKGDRA
jgi:hypothetical protein